MEREKIEMIVACVIVAFAGGSIPFLADWLATMMDVAVAVLFAVGGMGMIVTGTVMWLTRDATSTRIT